MRRKIKIWGSQLKNFKDNMITTFQGYKVYLNLGFILFAIYLTISAFETTEQISFTDFTNTYKIGDQITLTSLKDDFKSKNFIVVPKSYNWFNRQELSIDKEHFDVQVMVLKSLGGITVTKSESFIDTLKYRPKTPFLASSLVLLLIGFVIYGVSHSSTNTTTSQNLTPLPVQDEVSFEDIAGIDEVKEQITEVVELFKDSSKIREMGGKVPKGVLLNGPPGTGKTLLAKATAYECGANFLQASASEFVEMYVGVGADRVRKLFEKAKTLAPCIIFIDEIDAVGGQRGIDNNSEREQTLNQLLTCMDGFNSNHDILVFAATNRLDKLDKALLRPGRFDRTVQVFLPDQKGREQILKVYLNKTKTQKISIEEISRMTTGFAGADLANLVNEAIIRASRLKKNLVSQEELKWAFNKILMGSERPITISEQDKLQTAYHEIGHAFICEHLKIAPVLNVSIIPRGQALGVTHIENKDQYSMSKKEALNHLTMLLGGRVAEKIYFNNHLSTGASNDLQRCYNLARQMVREWGMSEKLGPISLSNDSKIAQKTLELIDQEIKELILEAEQSAHKILSDHKSLINILSLTLLEKESINSKEFLSIIKKHLNT